MIEALRKRLRLLLRSELYACYRMLRKGFLREVGWFESLRHESSIDRDGNPIPWITYSALAFLEPRVRPDMAVFEYGAGNSTLWWGRRVSKVVSCEHDAEWCAKLRDQLPETVELRLVALEPEGLYAQEIARFQNAFDIVVVDGRERVACIKNSLAALKSDGVIVFDNSARERYAEGVRFLMDHGFRRLGFEGQAPISRARSETAFFYRRENCLGI